MNSQVLIIIIIIIIITVIFIRKQREGFYDPSKHPELKDATDHAKFFAKRYNDEYFGKYYYHFKNQKPIPNNPSIYLLKQAAYHMRLLSTSLLKDEKDKTTKQFLVIEHLINEASSFDRKTQHYTQLIKPLSKKIISLKEAYLTNEVPQVIAQQVRKLRHFVSSQIYIYR